MADLSVITDVIGLPWLIFNTIVFIILYQCVLKDWAFFSRNNVKYARGLPFLGVQWRSLVGREPFSVTIQKMYDQYPDEKITGMFDMGGQPKYVIRDPELIQQITIKDFDHFLNHQLQVHEDSDPLFARSLLIMRDQRWKDMRSTLSPAFTGSKMRMMFSLVGEVSHTFCDYLKNDLKNGAIECDVKEIFARFANDTIASCAFGLSVNSLKDRDNDFYKTGRSISELSPLDTLKFFSFATVPRLAKFLKLKLFKEKDEQYFRDLFRTNMKYREQNNIVRPDMINILLEVKRGTLESEATEQDADVGFTGDTPAPVTQGKAGNTISSACECPLSFYRKD